MEPPARIGKYLIEEFLDGGEVETYRARDAESGRMVVVKVLTEAACGDAAARRRFLHHAEGCEHGEDDSGRPFLVTDPAAAPALRIVARKPAPAVGARPRRRWKWIATVVTGAALLAAAAFYYYSPRKKAASAPVLPSTLALPSGDMVLAPAGNFLFGEAKEAIWLPAFYIDKTEVTNAAYAAYCKASARDLPPGFPPDEPDYPVVNVSMVDARAFAAWAGKRLPSGREWEKAARGEDGRTFPWGEQPDRSRANIGLALLLPAGAFPKGASPYGALQMIGNAWEWVEDPRSASQEDVDDYAKRLNPPLASDELWYAVRGGGFDYPQLAPMLVWDSKAAPERWRSPDIGFRCVKDAR